jgi:hypothetical protein
MDSKLAEAEAKLEAQQRAYEAARKAYEAERNAYEAQLEAEKKAAAEAELIVGIRMAQAFAGQPITPKEVLLQKSIKQLREIFQQVSP